ncbi:hypothetical protein ABPG75_009006 [Micractinium tetrahymenae]
MRACEALQLAVAPPGAAACRRLGPSRALPRLAGLLRPAAARHARPQRAARPATVRAFTTTEQRVAAGAWEQQLPLGPGATVIVQVSTTGDEQRVTVATNRQGRLLLHWGVEGGKGYKGGWRLPDERCRPEGTVMYKNRALQTPFRQQNGNGVQAVEVLLSGDEASDYLNFVVKDESSGQWYDLNGTNFQVALRGEPEDPAAVPVAEPAAGANGNGNGNGAHATLELPVLLPLDRVPQLPQELCGIWAYIKWEVAGCPNRSKEEADREYEQGIQEMVMLLRRGRPLDELWRVSRGEIKYADYMQQWGWLLTPEPARQQRAAPAAPSPKKQAQRAEQAVYVPDDLVGVQPYILWEQAGKPDGADFGDKARQLLEGRLRAGEPLADVERSLRGPQPAPAEQQQQQKQQRSAPAAAPTAPQPAVVGQSMGMRSRNPLDMINRSAAPLLSEKRRAVRTPLTPLLEATQGDPSVNWKRLYKLGNKMEMLVTVALAEPSNPDSAVTINMTTTLPDAAVLHWGVKKPGRGGDWLAPPDSVKPPNTTMPDGGTAAETPFSACTEEECMLDWNEVDYEPEDFGGSTHPLQRIKLHIPSGHQLAALTFVIRSEDGTMWWRDGGGNFTIPVPGARARKDRDQSQGFEDELSRIIVDCEVNTGAWTLMHRFNKASDLLGDVMSGRWQDVEGSLARIYVWLRYSAVRQLTWQRNYNTQPRILGSAQERLTHAIADVYARSTGWAQEWARLMLTTVGRGGNAQAVRDEILNIMHRNKIKEVKGTWMEEWHQKLHNNTTPDDVPICEAYLAFLRSNGDLGAYWSVLREAGVTRQMLESYDRAIVTEPEFFPDKRDALIGEFENYLKILKAVHSGADLQASASAAASHVPGGAKGYLGYVLSHSNGSEILPIMEAAVEARAELQPVLRNSRDVLYLDLALENVVRAAAERGAGGAGAGAAAFVAPLLQNLALSLGDNEEVCYCLKAWQELPQGVRSGQRPNKDNALRAMAVIERIRRALAGVSDHVSHTLGPISQAFGEAFGCESWAVQLFPEEVVRGGPAFAVSLVLSAVEPHMRSAAELGAWQIISPANCYGRLEIVPDLHGIQEKVYSEPTILLAKRVTGEEEVPVGVVGLVSGDTPDVLSHLSVRSRNMRVLFASCHDPAQLDDVAKLAGKSLAFETTAAGSVKWREVDAAELAAHTDGAAAAAAARPALRVNIPRWCGKWVVGMDGFANDVVGAKSKNLAGLRGRLPVSIALPSSATVPFSAFEEALKRGEHNKQLARRLNEAIREVQPSNAGAALARCRDLVMQVQVPEELQAELREGMRAAGIPVPQSKEDWGAALHALKSVWASKYNDRAYVSTRKVGLNFDDVRMAVLCQRVVPAQYAFVIHTTNPTNGDAGEVYCELVRGLGEAIVSGTVPGTALTFVARKDDIDNPRVLLYPSKSEAMFVPDSLIFRSDSNGEDLQGYAGAGLYDSVTTAATETRKVDYSSDPLLTDPAFRQRLMADVCRTGLAIEQALGSAQDVEGVVDPDGKITVVQTRPQM